MHELHSFILFWILLAISPARLIPDPTSRLRKLDIGFWLPRKRSRRGSKNWKKWKPVELVIPCVLQSGFQTDLKRPSSVNSIPDHDPSTSQAHSCQRYSHRSVQRPFCQQSREKNRNEHLHHPRQHTTNVSHWDPVEGERGRRQMLRPDPCRLQHQVFSPNQTSFPFDHSSFELARVSLSMTQQTVNFRVYRPPPSRKNKQTDSKFVDQLHSL